MSDRQPVLVALDRLPDPTWVLELIEVRKHNHMLGMTAVDDPGPNVSLEKAIDAELARLGVNTEGLWK